MKENWKDIEGYEGRYMVSDLGRVKSLHQEYYGGWRNKQLIVRPERIMGTPSNNWGYSNVRLSKDGKAKTMKVHRLVGLAFIPNPNNKRTINHEDGNKSNNNVLNLSWCTHSENTQHAYNTGLIIRRT